MVIPNNLGPNLNGKAVNETQYRGMIGSLMYLKGKALEFFVSFLEANMCAGVLRNKNMWLCLLLKLNIDNIIKGDIELHFIPTQYQLADIFTKELDESTFRRLIVEL
ncbi:hypothetical protein Tco_1543130, partial [Tanacetum coccineum]